ncbi:T9SS type A sorting domain-containing protein [Hymenobacter sp. H14-R3]|uniref:T9SS type A sorting domain-containing protein n=1 Tax=Hymenobacter sp. H14-R3 TaxID=3046308 RepID=UPI0024BA93A2|nr:T9SS type A sorting domain-containing protein [Hymenobacter sp. H14-R3]MDJ0364653.1 T9SS type A sorting domain-containing protein [Hymenobacter sp. H14-R3]
MNTFTTYLLAAGLVTLGSRAASAQVLYDNFENTRIVAYNNVSGALAPVANPGGGTVNTSATCGKYDRDASQYAVVNINPISGRMANVSAYMAGTKKISMKFRSPGVGTVVQLVLQNKAKAAVAPYVYPQGDYAGSFLATTTAAAGIWETLTFTFGARQADATVTATDIDQLAMLVAPAMATAATYYLDDLMGPELVTSTVAAPVLLDNFETTRLLSYPSAQGTLDEAAANPGSSAGNTSATCASYARDGSQQYATINIVPKAGKFADVAGYISGAQTITLKFRSPAANTPVQLVLQNKAKATASPYVYPQGNFAGTFDATTSAAANTWETLTFKFNAGNSDGTVTATNIDQIGLLIAGGSASSSTYYFDDLTGPGLTTITATRASQTSAAALATAYPNPSPGLTHLPYSLQKPAVVSLALYDAMGRRVASVLDNQAKPAGDYLADLRTTSLAPGLYTCRLVVDGVALTRALSVE